MKNSIRDLLEWHGPCLSSDLIKIMEDEGITASAARQRISRCRSEFKRLAGVKFTKNTYFVYLEEQYGDVEFWDALEKAFLTHGKSYWSALVGLEARGGVQPEVLFPIICGAPNRRKKQLSPQSVLDRLVSINLLEIEEAARDVPNLVKFKPMHFHRIDETKMNAVLLAENIALNAIKNWARSFGLGSYDAFRIRGDDQMPVVSGVAWDLSAPSYARPLVNVRNDKLRPGFLVCDVNLNGTISVDTVELFIRKYDMAASLHNVSPIMALLVGSEFTSEAFDRAKSVGMLPTTLSHLFGSEVAKALKDLVKLLTDTGATAAVNPEHLETVINKLSTIEGSANNLRGALFELVIGNLVKDVEKGYLKVGLKRQDYESGQKAEIDVLMHKVEENKVLIIECKAKIPGAEVSRKDVKRWYKNRVPLIHKILNLEDRYTDAEFVFEIWTNGTFHESALEWLSNKEKVLEEYKVDWRNGAEIKRYADLSNSSNIKSVLKEHYFKNRGTVLYPN